MKDLFPGYFKESKEQIKEVWESCVFIFDTNILLNLYRYSDATRKEFLKILEDNKERVWLVHRVAEEYLQNRLTAIDKQETSYDTMISSVNSLRKDLENSSQHPFVSSELMLEVQKTFDKLCNELEINKKVHTKRITDDEILNKLSEVFAQRVGSPYSEDKLEEIIEKGHSRYESKVPPGYKDSKKSNSEGSLYERCRPYGDLIVWFQIIDKAINDKKPVILITNDKKEDWWQIFKGKIIGPRPELIKEFKEKVGCDFYMYQPDRFLELARENLDEQVSEELVEEIREVRRRDIIAHNIERELNKVSSDFKKPLGYIDGNDIAEIDDRIVDTQKMIEYLISKLNNYANKNRSLDNLYEKMHKAIDNGSLKADADGRIDDLIYNSKHNEFEINDLQRKIEELIKYRERLEVVLAHKKQAMENQQF